jgi:hypothetical protein
MYPPRAWATTAPITSSRYLHLSVKLEQSSLQLWHGAAKQRTVVEPTSAQIAFRMLMHEAFWTKAVPSAVLIEHHAEVS